MSLQGDKIREKADRVIDILMIGGRWALGVCIIAGIATILIRTVTS